MSSSSIWVQKFSCVIDDFELRRNAAAFDWRQFWVIQSVNPQPIWITQVLNRLGIGRIFYIYAFWSALKPARIVRKFWCFLFAR